MRCIHAITLTAAFLAPFIEGLELRKRDSPRVVGLPLERRSNAAVVSNTTNQLSKRGPGTLEAVLDNTVSDIVPFLASSLC